jgi:hypothetical protein
MRLRGCARDVASLVNTLLVIVDNQLLLGIEFLQGVDGWFCRTLSIPRTVGEEPSPYGA